MAGKDDKEEKNSIALYKVEGGDYISKIMGVSVTDILDVEVVTEEDEE